MPLISCENVLQLALRVLSSPRYQTRRSKTSSPGNRVRHCDSRGPNIIMHSSRLWDSEISGDDVPKICNFRLFNPHIVPPFLHTQLVPRQLNNRASDYSRLAYHSFACFEWFCFCKAFRFLPRNGAALGSWVSRVPQSSEPRSKRMLA